MGRLRSYVVRGSFGVGLWKDIRRLWDMIGDNMVFAMGNGVETILCAFIFPPYLLYS